MTVLSVPVSYWDEIDGGDLMVCVFCDTATDLPFCGSCQEYKGLMTVEAWESYTGEVWED